MPHEPGWRTIRRSHMSDAEQRDHPSHLLDILDLLDERYRLREDPACRADLEWTHTRLRERLRRLKDPQTDENWMA